MQETKGRSVRLFLVDGSINGVVTAEVINWSGHVVSGARVRLEKLLVREELNRTGVYFLIGQNPDDLDQLMVYIGESDNVKNRLKQHSNDDKKDFWTQTCIVTSKDQNITKAHARYLEARLINIATKIGRAKITNSATPVPKTLPESDVSDMEYFIEQIRLILPVIGFDTLTPQAKAKAIIVDGDLKNSLEIVTFEFSSEKLGIKAFAQEIDGQFIVLEGSITTPNWRQEGNHNLGYAKLQGKLLGNQTIRVSDAGKTAFFTKDTPFSSPSAASAIIVGRADNGRTSWKIKGTKKTYAQWQESKIKNIS
ncbi:MAG: GIY-YIG nuclease family protein [Rhizobiales bacterium]|nr:GIY-YIG nuclease family protein [Hyphomicrobiales bacterium]NRB13870.1 GIY-YIG nuclease family protein [Hyphomicrobiales bacterium]